MPEQYRSRLVPSERTTTNRGEPIRDGWKDSGKLFLAAVLIDVAYEIYVLRWVYPGQTLIVAIVLAVPSYVAIRGLTNRIARHKFARLTLLDSDSEE